MAKALVAATLDNMLKTISPKFVRGLIDGQPQYVTMYRDDVAEAFKEGFDAVMTRRKEANITAESLHGNIFIGAANKALAVVNAYVLTNKDSTLVTYDRNRFLSFIQGEKKIDTPFEKLKSTGLEYLNNNLENEIGKTRTQGEKKSFKVRNGKTVQRDPQTDKGLFGQGIQRLHGDKRSVGSLQLKMGQDYLSKTPMWKEFAQTQELQDLVDVFGNIEATFDEPGYDGTKNPKFDTNMQIGIRVKAGTHNKAGSQRTDWIKNRERLEKLMIAYAVKKKWADEKGSNTIREDARIQGRYVVLNELKKRGFKITGNTVKAAKRKQKEVSNNYNTSAYNKKRKTFKAKLAKTKRGTSAGNQQGASLYTVMAMISEKLPETVRKNMGAPRLENQTGTFANSVKMTDVIQTPQGYPSFGYTYAKEPYQVYETGSSGNWTTPERDPRKLIDASIREIAAGFALGRFYTRRQ